MNITKVAQYTASAPTATADWEGHSAHIAAFIQQAVNQPHLLTNWDNTSAPAIAQGCYLQHAGVLYIVDTADFPIATGDLSATGDYYIKLTTSGDTLTVEWENSLTGYSYNFAYQGLYNGSSQILPYIVKYTSPSIYNKYRFDIVNKNKIQETFENSNVEFSSLIAENSAFFNGSSAFNGTATVQTRPNGDDSTNAANTAYIENRLRYMGGRAYTNNTNVSTDTTIPAGTYYLHVENFFDSYTTAFIEARDSGGTWREIGRMIWHVSEDIRETYSSLVISDGTNLRIRHGAQNYNYTLIKIGG